MHACRDGIERSAKACSDEHASARPLRPFVAHIVRRPKTRLPIDCCSAAETRTGENRDAKIARGGQTALEIQVLHAAELALIEVVRLHRGSGLEDDDAHSFRGE